MLLTLFLFDIRECSYLLTRITTNLFGTTHLTLQHLGFKEICKILNPKNLATIDWTHFFLILNQSKSIHNSLLLTWLEEEWRIHPWPWFCRPTTLKRESSLADNFNKVCVLSTKWPKVTEHEWESMELESMACKERNHESYSPFFLSACKSYDNMHHVKPL